MDAQYKLCDQEGTQRRNVLRALRKVKLSQHVLPYFCRRSIEIVLTYNIVAGVVQQQLCS